ncbi:MAG: cytochrome c biogenesis protein CcsA [Pseudomonadota bacterium]
MPVFALSSFLVAGLYSVSAWQFLKRTAQARSPLWVSALLLAGIVIHAALLGVSVFRPDAVHLGFANAVSLIAWLSVSVYALTAFKAPLPGIQGWVAAVAAIGVLFPLVLPDARAVPYSHTFGFRLHLVLSLLAYCLLFIAALQAVLMSAFEKKLHHGAAAASMPGMPPLLTLESVLFKLIWAGFILLTLALASGILFSEEIFGKAMSLTHKTFFALVSWAIFGALLAGRTIRGWRGRLAVRWTITGFVMLLLAYVGSKFVLEVLLHR